MERNGEIRVSARSTQGSCVNQAKDILKEKGTVEFHAVGSSIPIALRAALRLEELKYTTQGTFQTISINDKGKIIYKIIILLEKGPEFDAVYEEFEKTKTNK